MSRATTKPSQAVVHPVRNICGVLSLSLEARDRVFYARALGLVTTSVEKAVSDRLMLSMGDSLAVCLDYSRTALAITA